MKTTVQVISLSILSLLCAACQNGGSLSRAEIVSEPLEDLPVLERNVGRPDKDRKTVPNSASQPDAGRPKVNDPDSLVEKLMQFEEEFSGSNTGYQNARDAYVKNYSPENNYKQLMNIYELAINAKKKNHRASN